MGRKRDAEQAQSVSPENGGRTVFNLPVPEPGLVFPYAQREIHEIAWSADGSLMAACGEGPVTIWPGEGGPLVATIGNLDDLSAMAWHPRDPALAIGTTDGTAIVWKGGERKAEPTPLYYPGNATAISWSPDGNRIALTGDRGFLSVWDTGNDRISQILMHGTAPPYIIWDPNGTRILLVDPLLALYEFDDQHELTEKDISPGFGHIRNTLKAIDPSSWSKLPVMTYSHDGSTAAIATARGSSITAATSKEAGRNITLEGLLATPQCIRFSHDNEFLAAATRRQMIIWRCRDWTQVAHVPPSGASFGPIAFHPSKPLLAAVRPDLRQVVCYRFDTAGLSSGEGRQDTRRYVNAKVVLLGDTGVGKSGLGLVLSGQGYQPTDSTHGRNVWMFDSHEVEQPGSGTQTREVLLWDLAGQPGYRLIHQLHLNEVAAALIVFDSRSETDPFSGVKHWVRALAQARKLEGPRAVPMKTYLVAARADRGGVAVTRERVQGMLKDFGLDGFFETSAREGWDVAELAAAIREGIDWDSLPMVVSNTLFQSIKDFLLGAKEQGRLLGTMTDLFHGFTQEHPDIAHEPDVRASFDACVARVQSRGLIIRLHFGDLVLLQPELLDAYASAMVQAAKEEPDGLGFIPEEEAIEGRFRMADSERVTDRAQERLLLIATVEELLRYEIALKEVTDRGVDLIFPSQFTREQPDVPNIPGKRLIFTFEGPQRSIYASLAVRLSHSTLFQRKAMWNNAAAYTATDGGTCGIHLRELDEGTGELALFFDAQAGEVVRAQFGTYVEDYLRARALPGTVTVRRVRVCPDASCGYVLPDDLVRRKLERGTVTMTCPDCEKAVVSLTDEGPVAPAVAGKAVAQMNRSADQRRDQNIAETRLHGKRETNDFDVFLCYASKDRDRVKAIGERLKERGLLPWLDIWEIPPGTRWQSELRKQIKSVKSAAVFLGPSGPGPWQGLEVETILNEFTKRKRPLIPVILDGRQGKPRFPDYLNLWQVVDMRQLQPDPFEQLVWGITGQRPFDA